MAKAELTAEQRDHLEQHVAGIGHNQGPALLEHSEKIIEHAARHHRLKAELTGIFGRNLLDDETQVDGFAALCGLQAYKPFECVGEVTESAAVMSYLGRRPDWQNDVVVRQLRSGFGSLRQIDQGAYRALLQIRHPHRVPDRYIAMLDASG